MLGDIDSKIRRALHNLNQFQAQLLTYDASERSIAHYLSIYIMNEFPYLDVDVEYNLNIDNERNRKELLDLEERIIELRRSILNRNMREIDNTFYYALSVYPDIIVHKRRSNRENLLIIEIKKSTNNNQQAISFDIYKLKKYTNAHISNEFKYKYGVYINLQIGETYQNRHEIRYFSNGNEVSI